MSTEIVDDVDDEAKSPSRMSSIMLIGRMYFSLYNVHHITEEVGDITLS